MIIVDQGDSRLGHASITGLLGRIAPTGTEGIKVSICAVCSASPSDTGGNKITGVPVPNQIQILL
jgi:hypothetical protein